jgi:type IV pilus assembly protein PilA
VEKRGIMKKMIKNKKGITLVELLAVIVILAIITAIAVPLIGNLITSTREGAAASDGNTVYASLRLWSLESPQDPAVSFVFGADATANLDVRDDLVDAIGNYISVVPASFENITFTVTGSVVTVTAGTAPKIGGYDVVWNGSAFVKP